MMIAKHMNFFLPKKKANLIDNNAGVSIKKTQKFCKIKKI